MTNVNNKKENKKKTVPTSNKKNSKKSAGAANKAGKKNPTKQGVANKLAKVHHELKPGELGEENITVRGARTHNLQNVTLTIPRNQLVVFTGLSGSGKSSLAFDTIFAEGQRRYIESLSSYARQFLQQMQKPDVDEIAGLSPAISIDQKSRSSNPRSTVATITEIYDYLRVLYARIGKPHCLECGREIEKLSHNEIKELIIDRVEEKNSAIQKNESKLSLPVYVEIYAPVVRGRKGEYYQMLYDLLNKGYSKVRVDGEIKDLREQIILDKNKRHDIDLLIDQINITDFTEGKTDEEKADLKEAEERLSEALEGALNETEGLVRIVFRDSAGARSEGAGVLEEFMMSSKYVCPYDGYSFPEVEPRLFSFNSPYGACPECNGLGTRFFFSNETCPVCNGARLRKEALNVTIGGKSIVEFTDQSNTDAKAFLEAMTLTKREEKISSVVFREIEDRLQFMMDVGIGYLTLNRSAKTLSGGEAQRIRLATQLGSKLVGALYVLDEPTIGLHPRDNERLVNTLKNLRDVGNTIIVVEHDEDTIFSSDYLVDIGPGAGVHGGQIVASGYLENLLVPDLDNKQLVKKSLTLQYLRGEKKVELPDKRRTAQKGAIQIRGGKAFNIKNLSVDIPLNKLITVTGVSGSGKSTFVYEILYKNLKARLEKRHRSAETFNAKRVEGTEYLGRTVMIDQSPIGRTPRSNPATYTGAFTPIRELFAETTEAKARGWKPRRFSFNVKGGRCETCQGNGYIAVEMHFLPTVYVPCDVCNGKRFMKETLEVEYRGKNIHDVLHMTVEESMKFFDDIPQISDRLRSLNDVGLGYLELGQSATTLSGGEAQRVKIASELYRQHTQKTMYILDEPTIGLHYEDVANLIVILQKLVEKGNTVLVIEHNMDLIKSSDYVIDIGPEGGEGGGTIVAKGTPEEVAEVENSHTGQYLKRSLKN
ncbi:MAG: excinuclease ABC subunit UvrA [Candidatus Paceibacterota bacterium]